MAGNPFLEDAEFDLSHLDLMVLATRDLYLADEQLVAWTGGTDDTAPRITRGNLLKPDLTQTAPFIIVGGVSWSTAFRIGCHEKNFDVGTILGYEVMLPEIADDQPTEAAVVQLVEKILVNSEKLAVPPGTPWLSAGAPWLAQKLDSLGTVQLDGGTLENKAVRVIQLLQATYSVPWNPKTGAPEA